MLTMKKRDNWQRRVSNVIRSRHYQWLAECRDGDPVAEVVKDVATDLMHICKQEGITWEQLMEASRRQFEHEEAKVMN